MKSITRRTRASRFSSFFLSFLICSFVFFPRQGLSKSQNNSQDRISASQAALNPPHDYESFQLESVFPGSSPTFDPFTFGRTGSPYGPGRLFEPGAGVGRCGPMTLPMSSQFADIPPAGNTQACLIIVGNGVQCVAEINHEIPGVAITFPRLTAIFTDAPWSIVGAATATSVTITNGGVTLRFTFSISSTVTTITNVEYL